MRRVFPYGSFYRDSFGNMVRHLKEHYDRIEIVSDNRSKWQNIPLWALLRETGESENRSPRPRRRRCPGTCCVPFLSAGRYPATLYNFAMLRIRAECDITRGRAAIIKAFLLRNTKDEKLKEVLTVVLNEQSDYAPLCFRPAVFGAGKHAAGGKPRHKCHHQG